ncbi:MAG: alpha-amylase family glycosyl hydrolase [Bacteroidota bacterium]
MRLFLVVSILSMLFSCNDAEFVPAPPAEDQAPFTWDNATVYFLMTDRFFDGDPTNNYVHTEANQPAPYRGYQGGDIKGVTQKIREGYFADLGVDAIWMTPLVEQIDGSVDEGTGMSFGFHGYWTRDWTALDEKFGTEADLTELVTVAHENGIRILIDVVANHTGPVTALDSQWPESWVKTGPRCAYVDAETTINCTLVENLPDIRTESEEEVELPEFIIEKWKSEGRYEREVEELEAWFEMTGYKRTPVNYILKWLVDFIREFGVDGFRVDTVKHTEEFVWARLWKQASAAWETYKDQYPEKVIDDQPFYMVGEVYNYFIGNGRLYDYGDRKVDFFKDGFTSMINFDFKYDATKSYEEMFSKYDRLLHGELTGKTVLNYASSHDDGSPYDKMRERPLETGTRLLLCQGGAQIFYGDETARSLSVSADGDAVLRSFMNWDDIDTNRSRGDLTTEEILEHWQKLGVFRKQNPAIGAGRHLQIDDTPYTFSRIYSAGDYKNEVVVSLRVRENARVDLGTVYEDGTELYDYYNERKYTVSNGEIRVEDATPVILLKAI